MPSSTSYYFYLTVYTKLDLQYYTLKAAEYSTIQTSHKSIRPVLHCGLWSCFQSFAIMSSATKKVSYIPGIFLPAYLWDRLIESWLWQLDQRVLILLHTAEFPCNRVISFYILIHNEWEYLFPAVATFKKQSPNSYRWGMMTDKLMAERKSSIGIVIHSLIQQIFIKCL